MSAKDPLLKALLIVLALMALTPGLQAHEVRPAYLEIVERAPNVHAVTWKQPIRGERRLRIDPVLPSTCDVTDESITPLGGTLIKRWQTSCDLRQGTVNVDGLNRTLTDVFVRIRLLDGTDVSTVLRPGDPPIDLSRPVPAATAAYLRLGIEHILLGPDHLLFVLGLFLLVRRNQLIATVTAFTVAHSITLALSALAGWSLPSGPVEIIIAMSISLLGLEALYRLRGRETLGARYPWSIAFGFGLIHGFGFAGALADIGLPPGAEIAALLLFNLGVEIGQLAFIAALIACTYAAANLTKISTRPVHAGACYALGVTGGFWTLERFAGTYFI